MPEKKKLKQTQESVLIETKTSDEELVSGNLINAPEPGAKQDYPILKNVNKLPFIPHLQKPNEAMVIQAHRDVGLKISSGSILHPKRMSRALEKYNDQKKLLRLSERNYEAKDNLKDQMIDELDELDLSSLMFEDTKKSPDSILLDNYGELKSYFAYIKAYGDDITANKPADKNEELRRKARLKTLVDIRTYYEVIEALMLNKYYARLPRAEMMELSDTKLMIRLNKLHENPDGKEELIDFYQNLLRLKRLGIHSAKDIQEREETYLNELKGEEFFDTRNADAEAKKLVSSYDSLVKSLTSKRKLLSADDREKRRTQFLEVCGMDIDNYINSIRAIGSEASGKLLADYDAYMRDRGKSKFENDHSDRTVERVLRDGEDVKLLDRGSRPPKGIELTEPQKNSMRVIQIFLLRRSTQDTEKGQSFVHNFLQAPPEQQLTAFYLVETGRQAKGMGADFYSALHGYIPDLSKFRKKVNKHFWGGTRWDVISEAVQAAKGLGNDMKEYASLSVRTEAAEEALEKASENPSKYMDQGKRTVEAISFHVASLRQLYALSGMHEDMPPDLAEDRKLREKMFTEYKRIGELSGMLGKLIKDHPLIASEIDDHYNKGVKSVIDEQEEMGIMGKAVDVGGTISKGIGHLSAADAVASGLTAELEGAAKTFTDENIIYNLTKGSVLSLSYVLAVVNNIYGIFQLAGKDSMSLAEGIASWTGKVNGVIGNLGWTGTGVLGMLKTSEAVQKGAGDVVTAGTVLSSINLTTSLVSVAVESIQLGRAIDNGKDLKKTRERLDSRTKNRELTGDEKKLSRYLKHQERETGRQKAGAGVRLAIGASSSALTYMAMTGVLAPLAGALKIANGVTMIGYNLIYDKMWRKDNIRSTVDEYLGVDRIVQEMKNNPDMEDAGSVSDSELKKHARREALGRLGYSSYKQCYREVCRQFATLLYTKLFCNGCKDGDEWNMYNRALGGLGFQMLRYKKDFGDNPKPTLKTIFTKIMG